MSGASAPANTVGAQVRRWFRMPGRTLAPDSAAWRTPGGLPRGRQGPLRADLAKDRNDWLAELFLRKYAGYRFIKYRPGEAAGSAPLALTLHKNPAKTAGRYMQNLHDRYRSGGT